MRRNSKGLFRCALELLNDRRFTLQTWMHCIAWGLGSNTLQCSEQNALVCMPVQEFQRSWKRWNCILNRVCRHSWKYIPSHNTFSVLWAVRSIQSPCIQQSMSDTSNISMQCKLNMYLNECLCWNPLRTENNNIYVRWHNLTCNYFSLSP